MERKDPRAGQMRRRSRANNTKKDWWRKLRLPRRGKKESLLVPNAPTDVQMARLDRRRRKLGKAVSAERTSRVKQMSVCTWDNTSGVCRIESQRGNYLVNMGYYEDGTQRIYPEEALYLMDKGVLDVKYQGKPISIQYASVLFNSHENSLSVNQYLTFAHLRRAGYIVRRTNSTNGNDLTPTANTHPEMAALGVCLAAWRVGSWKRKENTRPLFYVAVFSYEDKPPAISGLASFLDQLEKTRVKIALIDRGVVILSDVANNATPLSDRFKKRQGSSNFAGMYT